MSTLPSYTGPTITIPAGKYNLPPSGVTNEQLTIPDSSGKTYWDYIQLLQQMGLINTKLDPFDFQGIVNQSAITMEAILDYANNPASKAHAYVLPVTPNPVTPPPPPPTPTATSPVGPLLPNGTYINLGGSSNPVGTIFTATDGTKYLLEGGATPFGMAYWWTKQ